MLTVTVAVKNFEPEVKRAFVGTCISIPRPCTGSVNVLLKEHPNACSGDEQEDVDHWIFIEGAESEMLVILKVRISTELEAKT